MTGADGQLGNSLKELVFPPEYTLFFTNRKALDITNQEAVDSFFLKNKIDIVINCAAYTAVDLAESNIEACFSINEYAVALLARASAQNNAIFIHISSDYVYHPDHDLPMEETEPTSPKGVYAASKLAGELKALEINPKTIIIRTSWVYAKNGKNFVNTISRIAKERPTISVVNDQIGSPTYAPDLAAALLNVIQKSSTEDCFGIYNFSNDGYISWYDFALAIVKILEISCSVETVGTEFYPTPAKRPLNSRMIKTKFEDTFGIKMTNWQTSLEKCLS